MKKKEKMTLDEKIERLTRGIITIGDMVYTILLALELPPLDDKLAKQRSNKRKKALRKYGKRL